MNILVIVESPTKVPTIKSYLGKGYKVVASYGHVRDLPKSKFGVDIENDFEPQYINIRGKGQIIDEIKKLAKESDAIYLAGGPDREGEAISWHLVNILGKHAAKAKRITFNEITKTAVKKGAKPLSALRHFPFFVQIRRSTNIFPQENYLIIPATSFAKSSLRFSRPSPFSKRTKSTTFRLPPAFFAHSATYCSTLWSPFFTNSCCIKQLVS